MAYRKLPPAPSPARYSSSPPEAPVQHNCCPDLPVVCPGSLMQCAKAENTSAGGVLLNETMEKPNFGSVRRGAVASLLRQLAQELACRQCTAGCSRLALPSSGWPSGAFLKAAWSCCVQPTQTCTNFGKQEGARARVACISHPALCHKPCLSPAR